MLIGLSPRTTIHSSHTAGCLNALVVLGVKPIGVSFVIPPQHQEVSTIFTNHINRIHSRFIVGATAALLFALPCALFAQSSPLTVQPSTGRVGVGNTNPAYPVYVAGTVNARVFRVDEYHKKHSTLFYVPLYKS
jgi:hypothetical protein